MSGVVVGFVIRSDGWKRSKVKGQRVKGSKGQRLGTERTEDGRWKMKEETWQEMKKSRYYGKRE